MKPRHLRGEYVFMLFLTNMKVIWIYYLLLINAYKFMSGYLYSPNNLKDIKDHI